MLRISLLDQSLQFLRIPQMVVSRHASSNFLPSSVGGLKETRHGFLVAEDTVHLVN